MNRLLMSPSDEPQKNNPSYYVVIPAEVRYDSNLTPHAILMYGEITALANTKGYCFAKNKYFRTLYGVKDRSISRWLKQLRDGGYITVKVDKNKEGTFRRIYLNHSFHQMNSMRRKADKNVPPSGQNSLTGEDNNMQQGIDDNVGNNNTSSSTINTTTKGRRDFEDKFNLICRLRDIAQLSDDQVETIVKWIRKNPDKEQAFANWFHENLQINLDGQQVDYRNQKIKNIQAWSWSILKKILNKEIELQPTKKKRILTPVIENSSLSPNPHGMKQVADSLKLPQHVAQTKIITQK